MTEAAETNVSTPETTTIENTSFNESANADTSDNELQNSSESAETIENANNDQERLYANKYKSVEELEKGYTEAQKTLTQNAQYKKQYEDLLKQQQAQQAIQLEKARQQGFNSVEAQEIAQNVALAEFNAYFNNINLVGTDNANDIQQLLNAYYNSGNTAYLEEAKRYYPSDFIENVAINKQQYLYQLQNQLKTKEIQQKELQEQELATLLKADFNEFLSDLNINDGKSRALKSFCYADFINSKEDMQSFYDIYSQIAKYEREQAIKEYEAQKLIDKTKQAANISTGQGNSFDFGDNIPTYSDIQKMSQEDYNRAVNKYGLDKILAISK